MGTCKSVFSLIAVAMAAVACHNGSTWTKTERDLIGGDGETMRVLTVCDKADSLVLRTECIEINRKELRSDEYKMLADKMVKTVTSPEEDGVGIAGPQVGILRRIVAVQRFDKENEPFEVYPNIRIIRHRGEKEAGSEGCLSIPGKRGNVERYKDIDIRYTSLRTLRDTTETVKGFTAVIFQHECDHLDGILYTDYLNENTSCSAISRYPSASASSSIGVKPSIPFRNTVLRQIHWQGCNSQVVSYCHHQ